ncbi:helix-turn-helix transcriptional regulator [Arthrobacter sp. CAN_C5]|uniref:helix-turn-helix domain-containing protein n=1 Tax=Arthrobacter sp. CAN_C5 TaxID=2760706 RepID=UPI001AE39014|nr:helix-turn-helix transcriptional regulator [Arthrobacter sp. CAN_C5]MBP2216887.1 putative transcriptional regulator [Arthrobacter sp. CAN_C5]
MKDPNNDNTSDPDHFISIHLDELLTGKNMSLAELARRVGITVANLSILKNGRAKAIRFSTLSAICRELDCTPGDIITYRDTKP